MRSRELALKDSECVLRPKMRKGGGGGNELSTARRSERTCPAKGLKARQGFFLGPQEGDAAMPIGALTNNRV